MKRRFTSLVAALLAYLLVLSFAPAHADAYIIRTPAKDQIQEEEALQIACDYIHDLTGVEITGIFMVIDGMKVKNEAVNFFGPGYQWGADTNDDCWVLDIQNESTIVRPWVVLHGTTGEVLYWQYTDQVINCSYINMLPNDAQLSYEDAVEMAMNGFMQVMDESVPIDTSMILANSAFGSTSNWNSATVNLGDAPAWSINLSYTDTTNQYEYSVYINAENGTVFGESLLAMALSSC